MIVLGIDPGLTATGFGLLSISNDKPQIIDYGTIEPSSEGTRVFTFINNGNAPLIIKNVQSSCGCTIPKKPEDPIDPGEKGEILVRYDTNRIGVFNKSIIVTSNANSDPIITLRITGIVGVKGK